MKNVSKLLLVTCLVGFVGWRIIRTLSSRVAEKNIRRLLGKEWIREEMLCDEPHHPLGKWHKNSADNPIVRYTDQLVGFILESPAITRDGQRLATKLKSEFFETLSEMDYAVFLATQGFAVTMEPSAPEAGPDLLAVRGSKYHIEIRRVAPTTHEPERI